MRPVKLPGHALRAVHLAVLSSFALAQPLFDILGRNATFFAVRGSSSREIVLFALALTVLPPSLLFLVELGAGALDSLLGLALHLLFVAALAAAIALQVVKRLDGPATALLLAAAVIGLATAVLYRRFRPAQVLLTVLGPAPLLFLVLFLGSSDVSRLVFNKEPDVQAAHTRARAPVVLIVLDEFATISMMDRDERIDAQRFPNFARLANDATWFRSTTSVNPHSESAVPAVLSGSLPLPHHLPTYADHPHNIFTLFGGDYRLHVFESLTSLCPSSLCHKSAETGTRAVRGGADVLVSDSTVVYLHLLLPDSLAARVTPIADSWGDFKGLRQGAEGQTPEADSEACGRGFCNLIHAISADRRPSLYVLHVLLPHVPWTFLPSGKRYTGNVRVVPGAEEATGWRRDDWLALQAYQRFLLQLAYTDRELGLVLDRLRSTGVYDRAVVVVTADHGLSFRLGEPRRNVSRANLVDIAFVPLFVKLPHQREGRIVDGYARTIDILPTIADAAHARLPWRLDGHSLLNRTLAGDGTVSLPDQGRRPVSAPLSTLLAERKLALERQIAAFGTGSRELLYRIGPHQDLLGKQVRELAVKPRADVRVALDEADLLRTVDLHSAAVPAYVTGRVRGGSGTGEELAVAVNGVIGATTRTYDDSGEERFAALVPDRMLRTGSNDVEVFEVSGGQGAAVLERLRASSSILTVGKQGGREVIKPGEGPALDVVRDALSGEVRSATPGQSVILSGWAADVKAHQAADSVAVFLDGRSILVSPVDVRDKGVEKQYGVKLAGFRLELPRRLLPKFGEGNRVRIFAIRGQTASELQYQGGYLLSGR